MKKRKAMALALCAAMMMGTFGGFEVKAADDSSATEMEFWTFVELHGQFYENMAEKWNEANPDKQVKVNVNVMPYDDMHNKLQIALTSGEGAPDFVDIEQGKFANFTQGTPALMDLTDAAEPYTSTGDIVQSRLDLYSKDGKLYGLPTHVGATVAFYNTELLDAAGIDYTTIKTWDDFKAACEKLEANGTTPLVISGKNGSTLTGTMEQLNSFYTIDGAPYESREALKDGSFDFTKNTQFLDLYAELYDNGWFNEDIFTADQTTQFKYLGSGDYGFIPWGSPANIQTMKTYTPDVNFGIIPVPAVEEGGNAAYTVGEGSCLAISNTSENIDCCKALLNFLLEKDNLTEYCTANGGMPGLSDVTPEDSESLELYKKSVEAAGDNITYSNFFDREYLPSGMWNVMQETMAKLYNGEVGTAKDRVAEAASYFQENYKTLLGTNG